MTVTNEQLKTLITNNATTTNANFKKAKQAINGKVDKVEGKGLSTNDFTDAEKNKLAALPTNADLQSAIDAKTTMAAVEAKGYQTASDVATAIANADHLKREIVQALPAVASADANTIYMVLKSPAGDSGNVYNEYFLINGAFELIGDSKVDLTGYATETYVNGQGFLKAADIAGKQDTIDASHKLSADLVDDSAATNKFVTAAEKSKIAEVDNKVEAQDVTDAINAVFGDLSITAWDDISLT